MKKAQLQIMENVFILIIIFIIFIFAFLFYVRIQRSNQIDKIDSFKDIEFVKKAQLLSFLPELMCTDNNVIKVDCYDILKIEAFTKEISENRDYYDPLFGKVNITVKRYEPSPDFESWNNVWNIYDNPTGENKGVREEKFFVLLRDVTTKSDYFGVLFIGLYE